MNQEKQDIFTFEKPKQAKFWYWYLKTIQPIILFTK